MSAPQQTTGIFELRDESSPHTVTYVVTYLGYWGPVSRTFPSLERATQWARQIGIYTTLVK